ncbi:MAG: FHA domain-containing protein [Gammaproteobacteria bacterium]|nr:FHA domain-containing protein [Gammaproteobacteria bacterium]
MPSLTVKLDHTIIKQINLPQGDLSIGRRVTHGLVLEDSSVSADHATIFTVGQDSFLKDLNSTNGTFINNRRVNKHHLKHGDTIVIGKHIIVYGHDTAVEKAADGPQAAVEAALFVLTGPNSGRRIDLKTPITHLGKTGRPAALLSRIGDRFTLMPEEGAGEVLRNNKPVPAGGIALDSGDLIEVGDTRLQFYQR